MPFILPAGHVKIKNSGKKIGEPLAPRTVTNYMTILNKLAKQGYDTPEKLIENHQTIIQQLEAKYPLFDSKHCYEKRKFMCAVLYALDKHSHDDMKPYYDAFQKYKVA